MSCSLKSSLVLFSCIFVSKTVVSSLSFEYSGYKLYRVIPENDTQLEVLLILRNSNSGLFFWNGIDTIGKEVDILVNSDVRSFFLEHLISHHIIVKEYFSDVKILMEQKEQPLILALETSENDENHVSAIEVEPQHVQKHSEPILVQDHYASTDNSSVERNLIPIQSIQGTRLFTGTFYTIGLLRYPKGFVTLAEQTTDKGNYVQIDFKSSAPQYSPGGKRHLDAQWVIVPTEEDGLFLIVSRSAPKGIFTWTGEKSPNGNFVQISRNPEDWELYQPGGNLRRDAMILINTTEVENHYIIQMANLPYGNILTWTNKYGGSNNKFLQVDTSPDSRNNYHPGQKWRDDVLFKFTEIRKIKLSGIISEFRYEIDNSSTILPIRKIDILSTDKLKIPNNSGVPQSFGLKHNKTMTSHYSFKFNQSFQNFAKVSCKANLPLKPTHAKYDANNIEFQWTEGTELEKVQTMEQSVKDNYVIDTVVSILPHRTLEASWYFNWVDNLQVKFSSQIAITGFMERMAEDRKVYSTPVSALDVYYFLSSENIFENIIGIHGNEVLVNLEGTFKGSYAIKDTFITKNV